MDSEHKQKIVALATRIGELEIELAISKGDLEKLLEGYPRGIKDREPKQLELWDLLHRGIL